MTEALIIITLLAFPAIALARKKKTSSRSSELETFTLGSQDRKAFSIAAGISMSFVGGAAMLNMSSLGYQYGWSVLVDPIAVFLALILAIVFISRIREGRGVTITSILTHSSARLNVFLGMTSFFVYQLLTAAQFVAIGKLLAPYFPDVPFAFLVTLPALSVFLYIYARGFESVTKTDILQLTLILSLFALPTLWVFSSTWQGSATPELIEIPSAPLTLLTYLALPFFFVPVSNDTNIRVKAASSAKQASIGLLLGGFFYVLLVTLAISIGVFLRIKGHPIDEYEKTLPVFFSTYLGPLGVISVVAILAAIVSTLDSFAFDAIVSVANDVLKPIAGQNLPDRKVVAISTGVVLATALIIALAYQQILGLILAGMLLYVAIFIPVAIGRLLKISDELLFWTSMSTAVAIVASKLTAYVPPVEPIAFISIHLVLICIAKVIQKK
jgi:Na+/proline symporter